MNAKEVTLLTVVKHDPAFIPAKRLFSRKPLPKIAFKAGNIALETTICNN